MAATKPTQSREFLQWKVQYLISRRELDDASLWQAPALGLTAQAFLLTIALDQDATIAARLMSSILALLTAVASLYLIGRKRRLASLNEEEFKTLAMDLYGEELNIKLSDRAKAAGYNIPWYLGLTATAVWMIALTIFLLFDIIIAIKTLYDFVLDDLEGDGMDSQIMAAILGGIAVLVVALATNLTANWNVGRTLKAQGEEAHKDRMWLARSEAYVATLEWSYGGPVNVDTSEPIMMAPEATHKLQVDAFNLIARLSAHGSHEVLGIYEDFMRVRILEAAIANAQSYAGSPEYHWLRKHLQPLVDAYNQLQAALVAQVRHELQRVPLQPLETPDMKAKFDEIQPKGAADHYRQAWDLLGEVKTHAAAVKAMEGLRLAWAANQEASPRDPTN